MAGKEATQAENKRKSGLNYRGKLWPWGRYIINYIEMSITQPPVLDCNNLFSALARLFHSLGSKVILAARNTQQLERIKFQLDSEHVHKVSVELSVCSMYW